MRVGVGKGDSLGTGGCLGSQGGNNLVSPVAGGIDIGDVVQGPWIWPRHECGDMRAGRGRGSRQVRGVSVVMPPEFTYRHGSLPLAPRCRAASSTVCNQLTRCAKTDPRTKASSAPHD